MTTNWNYDSALRAIWERSAYDRGFISNPFAGDEAADLGLRRTAAILDLLGRPQDRYGIVHVAGSKGKGSTSVFIDSILNAAGFRVGRYTQPHLHTIRERIAVNGEAIDETAFATLTRRGVEAAIAIEKAQSDLGEVTAFELTTAMALDYFATAECELAVVEVGLGGTLDATNVVDPLVAVITNLDLEHTAILGNTLEQIAAQKAGIIKPGRPVVVSRQPAGPLEVIKEIAARNGSQTLIAERDWTWAGNWQSFDLEGPWGALENLRLGLAGSHQVENASTAVAAVMTLKECGFSISELDVRTGLEDARWPGRFEIVQQTEPRIILDGAHTPASAAALARTIEEDGSQQAVVVIGLLGDKDALTIGRALAPVAIQFVVTSPKSPRAASPKSLASLLDPIDRPIRIESDVPSALTLAIGLAGSTGTVVVTGSLSTVAEARETLGLATPDKQPHL